MNKLTKEELVKYNVHYPKDTNFSAYARLLQSKWRDKKGYPQEKLGNYLEVEFAKRTKANYLTDNIKQLVTNSIANARKVGALISEPRIWNNLLSSQPLCFNLFGELHYDLDFATKYFKAVFPDRIEKVTAIKFEYSAGRGNTEYTGDHSAFDVFVEYTNAGKKGFIGIEVKYTESLKEESKEKANAHFLKHQNEYSRLTTNDIFKEGAVEYLRQTPLSQIWRDHLLAIAHLKDYDEGFFVFLFPKANAHCQNGVDEYKKYLRSDSEETTGFYPRYLDDFIATLISVYDADWTRELQERYLGNSFKKVETKHFKLAHKLNEDNKELLLKEKAHFRGSVQSLSLISLNNKNPELGIPKLNFNKYSSGNDIPYLIKQALKDIQDKPGRPTPEKELQSWIIYEAFKNNNRLPFDEDIEFITSEIAILNSTQKKIVTDILGYNKKKNLLCVIELKSERLETRLIEQVNNFENVILEMPEFFSELLSVHGILVPKDVPLAIAKLIVWPHKHTSPRKKLKESNIIEITYEEHPTIDNHFTFRRFN